MGRTNTEAQKNALARLTVATRCFRDTGDEDYIAARMAYRAGLVYPFLWSSLQAIEKYLKCILILNNITTHKLGHDIRAALDRINKKAPFKITLNKLEQEIFDHIAEHGPDRYLIYSYYIYDKELLKLDRLVWQLRQYCRVLDFDITLTNGEKKNMLRFHLDEIENSWNRPAKYAQVHGGKLETILAKKNHAARAALVWKNMRYSVRHRASVPFRNYASAVNAPLWLDAELLPRIRSLVHLSKEDIDQYTRYWQEQKADSGRAT